MPASYRIDTALGVVFTVATGVTTDSDWLVHQMMLSNDSDFRPGMRHLADLREATELEMSGAGINTAAAADPWGKDAKRACVAVNESVRQVVESYMQSRSNPEDDFRLFSSMDEARAWLGLPPESN